ncbi:MAG TPA: hypothetical protein P5150_01595 [Candidatus Ratteibacteria bacterium]|nr:hypothetical protein [Candidatus Ratteibacteria bacterium]
MKKIIVLGLLFAPLLFAETKQKTSVPASTSEIERQLLSLQQQIAIENKRNELLKIRKENTQIEKEMKPEQVVIQQQPASASQGPSLPPYSYISSFPEPERNISMVGELELVGISGKRAIAREGEKYFYLAEGQEIKNCKIIKIEGDGVYLKDPQQKIQFIGLTYKKILPPPEQAIQQQPVKQQETKK